MKHTDLIEFQHRQEEELRRRKRIKNQFEYDRLTKQTRTRTASSTITDMRDAYQQVRDFDYQPTQQEIEFRRFVTGCGYNATKGSK